MEPREAFKAFFDSVSYIIDVDETPLRHIEYLPLKMIFAGKYRFSENFSAGIVTRIFYQKKYMSNLLSAYGQAHPGEKLTLAGSLSVHNFKSLMAGLGISYTVKNAQFYLSTNNIYGIINPTDTKHINLCLGMNLLFDINKAP
jgi:hypothetical protein